MLKMVSRTAFEPKILGFLCNWCAYAGADLAGVSRLRYPPNLRVLRVMCSARVDPVFIVDAFIKGVDGILVGGCHLGDCHYIGGNYEAVHTIHATKKVLDHAGVCAERLLLEWVSAAEGVRFAEVIKSFTQQIKELGPLGSGEGESSEGLPFRLKAAKAMVAEEKVRWIMAKQSSFQSEGNVYGEVFSRHEIDRLLDGLFSEELVANEILLLLQEESLPVTEISRRLNLPPAKMLVHISSLRKKGLIALAGIRGNSPLYTLRRDSGKDLGRQSPIIGKGAGEVG